MDTPRTAVGMRADSENTRKTELFHSFSGMSLGNMAQVRVALGLLSGEKPVLGCRESPGAGWSRAALLPLAMRTTLCREGTCTGTGDSSGTASQVQAVRAPRGHAGLDSCGRACLSPLAGHGLCHGG